ncbi:MAG: hypothetical protein RL235_384, partial [Chlamydiota bacterium]
MSSITLRNLTNSLLPPPITVDWNDGNSTVHTYNTARKVAHFVKQVFCFFLSLAISPLTLAYDFTACVLRKRQAPKPTPDIQPPPPSWPPDKRGYACSLFQTSGVGTRYSATPGLRGRADWDQWMDNPRHVIHPEGFDYRDFFIDILTNPDPYIAMLKEQNANAHRFSLEWSVIEPEPGQYDEHAIELYRTFIRKLEENGIEPSVTLNHFVLPQWFINQGGFQRLDNVDLYLRFAKQMLTTFPDVREWWSFNELGVLGFQRMREVFPTDIPEGSSTRARVHAAGLTTMHMLIAHCKLTEYARAHAPRQTIGVTHQWLKFDTETGNPLEKTIAKVLTSLSFQPVYDFFKTGSFRWAFPFMANIRFRIPPSV